MRLRWTTAAVLVAAACALLSTGCRGGSRCGSPCDYGCYPAQWVPAPASPMAPSPGPQAAPPAARQPAAKAQPPAQDAPPGMSPEDEEMFAEMMRLAEPGEHHAWLGFLEGTWNTEGKFWMDPDQPPTASNGTATYRWELGNRFLRQDVEGDFEGMPFHGLGIYGYDNKAQEYQVVWMDSMGTVMLHGKGTRRGDVLTTNSEWDSPWGLIKMRDELRKVSDDEFLLTAWHTRGSEPEAKAMEIRVRRAR